MSRDRFNYRGYDVGYTADVPTRRHPIRIPERVPYEREAPPDSVNRDEMLRRIRESATAEATIPGIDVTYSPLAVGMNAIPFSDELLGIAADVTSDADYDETQRAAEQARYEASANHLGSAIVGGLGQAALTAPLALTGAPTGSTALIRYANAASPAVATGMALGGIGSAVTGALRGEDATASERAASAAERAVPGALTGGAVGGLAGTLGHAGRALAGIRSAILGAPARIVGGALTGAGYGVAQTPDMSGSSIAETDRGTPGLPGIAFGTDIAENASVGGAFGGAASALAEAAGAVPRARNYVQGLFGRLPDETGARGRAPIPAEIGAPDEAMAIVADTPTGERMLPGIVDDVAAAPASDMAIRDLNAGVREAAESARINTGDIIEDFVRTGLRRNPAVARLQSLGMTDAEIRRAAARFGNDPERLVAAAREFDLLPPRPYDPSEQVAAVERLRQDAGANVRAFRDRLIGHTDETISGASIADDIEALADELSGTTSRPAQRRAEMLREVAQDFRYGVGVRPTVDPATNEIIIPPDRNLTGADLFRELDQYSEDLAKAYRSADPSPDSESLMDVRRILASVRDRFAGNVFQGDTVPGSSRAMDLAEEYARNNRAFQVASALSTGRGGPSMDRRQYGMFRGMLGSMAGGQAALDSALPSWIAYPAGRVAGFLAENTAARYLPSLIATANEGGFANAAGEMWPGATQAVRTMVSSPAVPASLDRMTAGVERLLGTDPSAFGRLAGVLEESARRGTLSAVVQHLARNNPEFASLVQRITPQDEQRMEAEQSAPDALIEGIDPSAPPPDAVGDDADDEDPLIYGTARR